MGGSTLRAEFSFPMDSDRQHISGRLGQTDLTSLNKALEPLAFVQIEDGTINTNPWITHRVDFDGMIAAFSSYTHPETGVIKAVVDVSGE